jgi:hypothetical protein
MKRTWMVSVLSLCFCLLFATTWIMLNPVPAYAATGTADCGNGLQVSCNAADCDCTDGIGCIATNPYQPSVFTGCIGAKPADHPMGTQGGTVTE